MAVETDGRIPAEMLEGIYEEWVAYPDKRERKPFKEHASMASRQGWWPSGWRGVGPEMEALPPIAEAYFQREHH
jgi:hypothetical protein